MQIYSDLGRAAGVVDYSASGYVRRDMSTLNASEAGVTAVGGVGAACSRFPKDWPNDEPFASTGLPRAAAWAKVRPASRDQVCRQCARSPRPGRRSEPVGNLDAVVLGQVARSRRRGDEAPAASVDGPRRAGEQHSHRRGRPPRAVLAPSAIATRRLRETVLPVIVTAPRRPD